MQFSVIDEFSLTNDMLRAMLFGVFQLHQFFKSEGKKDLKFIKRTSARANFVTKWKLCYMQYSKVLFHLHFTHSSAFCVETESIMRFNLAMLNNLWVTMC